MPDTPEDLSAPSAAAPAAEAAVTAGEKITAAKFRSLIDMLDVYMEHSHTFNDDYASNCECQCGRGSI